MNPGTFRCTLICLFLLSLPFVSKATHLRAVEVQVVHNCNSLTVEVIVTAYVNFLGTNVSFGGDDSILDFGDGKSVVIPETDYEVIDAELYVGRAQYRVTHSYASFGSYRIAYSETNRNAGVVNFSGSVNTPFYAESTILLGAGVCNSSPKLLAAPLDKACTGVAFSHNAGAVDVDGDSLSYALTTPKKAADTEVTNYLFPNHPSFYTGAGIEYEHGNERRDARPSFTIDPVRGTLTWDAPGAPGEYALAIKVTEWKRDETTGARYEAGYTIRDMQIIVEQCSNERPRLDVPVQVCVIAGTTMVLEIPADDPDHDDIVGEAFSEIFTLAGMRARIDPGNGVSQSTNPPDDTASFKIIWETTCADVRMEPYSIVLKISDRPSEGPRLASFYALEVMVIPPEPEYQSVSINPVTKEVTLRWQDYECDNVVAFQVWRRVSEFRYQTGNCEIGIPQSLHYELREELPGSATNFNDKDLAIGSQYCYRIVALVGDGRMRSRMSMDTCFIPKPAEAPVVVNVSVQRTDTTGGQMLVRWTRPFDIDPFQYPPPYQYKVFRMNASQPDGGFNPVTPEAISDTLLIDTKLNTAENIHSYRIELYVPALAMTPVDTSSVAASVYAESDNDVNQINISWHGNTPWSNHAQQYPYHLIYRSSSLDGNFQLIDSVDVNQYNFRYTDTGDYDGLGLTSSPYYYKVMTRGTYGNPGIVEPLENFSQAVLGQLLDTIPPCAVTPVIREAECSEFACDGSDYSTTVEWNLPCDDVVAYEVLVKDAGSHAYTKIASTTENVFVHKNITSLNKCYRIITFDQAGNRSDSSAVVCNSNCINFKLPNVITPGVKDDRNDYLTTFSQAENNGQDCARSVESVRLKIFSRWGHEVFTTTLYDDSVVFWDGRNAGGEEVASGVYFYHAEVIFDTSDAERRKQRIQGWVHVLK
jgi:hypothetical protein